MSNFKRGPKLTWFDALQVRIAVKQLKEPIEAVAGAFEISRSHVSNIVHKNRWPHPVPVRRASGAGRRGRSSRQSRNSA